MTSSPSSPWQKRQIVSLTKQEVSIELRTPADATPYLPHRYRSHASMNPPHRPGNLSEIIEAQQTIRITIFSQTSPHLPNDRPSTGTTEVCVYLFFNTHVVDHRQIFSSS
jgi:hypothetical protein